MTDTNPTCEICGAELVEEIRTLHVWTVKISSVRGPPVEEARSGWRVARRFDCDAVVVERADGHRQVDTQCQYAHTMALKLKRRIAELEAEKVTAGSDPLPSCRPEYQETIKIG